MHYPYLHYGIGGSFKRADGYSLTAMPITCYGEWREAPPLWPAATMRRPRLVISQQ